MNAAEYVKQFKTEHEDGLISYEALIELMIGFSEHQNKELSEENEKKDIQLTEAMNTLSILRKDANEADHADYCMCRFCAPDFNKLKETGKPG